MPFTPDETAVLSALAETFFPSLPAPPLTSTTVDHVQARHRHDLYARSALAQDHLVLPSVQRSLELLPPTDLGNVKMILYLLSTRPGTLLLTGHVRAFPDLSIDERVGAMRDWSASSFMVKRSLFQAFKGIILSNVYGALGRAGTNPTWPAVSYPGPDPRLGAEEPEDLSHVEAAVLGSVDKDVLRFDAVIVGSGAGGGVMAAELAKAGYSVLVLEKGPFVPPRKQTLVEKDAIESMYEGSGYLGSKEGNMSIAAGATVGGGTTINWCASFRTPESVRTEWANDHHLPFFATDSYERSLDAVCERIGVHDTETVHNSNNTVLVEGCKRLGFQCSTIPRNAKGSHQCGWCCFGCFRGHKQSSLNTWLGDAARHGAKIIPQCHVERVLVSGSGRAEGVVASLLTQGGRPLTIHAKVTVLSAGSIHTPALMLRSKIRNSNIGKNLRLHPVVMGIGFFDNDPPGTDRKPYDGCMMSGVSKQFANLDGKGYGALIETPPIHASFFSVLLPWTNPAAHKESMMRYKNASLIFAIQRDHESRNNYVTIDADGRPEPHYTLTTQDERSLFCGLEACLQILAATGATEIVTPHLLDGMSFKPTSREPNETAFVHYIDRLRARGIKSHPMFSAHQMGTCRMGASPSKSVVNSDGESWNVKNLFVADASVFPTSSGVNPMVTIEAISHHTAQHVKARLRRLTHGTAKL